MKTKEFIRVECMALNIAQWCIIELLPDDLKCRNVFFTKIIISILPIKECMIAFKIDHQKEYMALNIEANFTTLTETASYTTVTKNGPERPIIQAKMLFENMGTNGTIVWKISAFQVDVEKHSEINKYSFLKQSIFYPDNYLGDEQELRVNRFKVFLKNLFKRSFGEFEYLINSENRKVQ